MRVLIAIASGLLFGLGLVAGGMSDPSKVQGFLDLFGQWDPSLAFVMGGAIVVGIAGFALARRQEVAWSGDAIDLPQSKVIDSRLLIGGALFGVGWGLGGLCPGPAVTALGAAFVPAAWFVAAMLLGMWLHDRFFNSLLDPGTNLTLSPDLAPFSNRDDRNDEGLEGPGACREEEQVQRGPDRVCLEAERAGDRRRRGVPQDGYQRGDVFTSGRRNTAASVRRSCDDCASSRKRTGSSSRSWPI